MTPDQRTRFTQGIVFGVFFQYLGFFIKDASTRNTPPYFGGYVAIIMGVIIFAWGCTHLVAAKRLPPSARYLGLLSLVGLGILWLWPAKDSEAPSSQA